VKKNELCGREGWLAKTRKKKAVTTTPRQKISDEKKGGKGRPGEKSCVPGAGGAREW